MPGLVSALISVQSMKMLQGIEDIPIDDMAEAPPSDT
jgi:hypothetical protein